MAGSSRGNILTSMYRFREYSSIDQRENHAPIFASSAFGAILIVYFLGERGCDSFAPTLTAPATSRSFGAAAGFLPSDEPIASSMAFSALRLASLLERFTMRHHAICRDGLPRSKGLSIGGVTPFPQNALPAGRKKSDILRLYFGGNVIPESESQFCFFIYYSRAPWHFT